jgi:hypothetical protein
LAEFPTSAKEDERMIAFVVCAISYLLIAATFWKFKILRRQYLEATFMWIMIFGIVALCQPWMFFLYQNGFAILSTGTLGYILAIHMK